MKTLTQTEALQILDSCELNNINIESDFSIRYTVRGYTYYNVANINNLMDVEFPTQAHICNVTDNMNYITN